MKGSKSYQVVKKFFCSCTTSSLISTTIGSSGKAFKQQPYSNIPTFSFLTSQKTFNLGYNLKAPLSSSSSTSNTANDTVTSLGIVQERFEGRDSGCKGNGREGEELAKNEFKNLRNYGMDRTMKKRGNNIGFVTHPGLSDWLIIAVNQFAEPWVTWG